MISAFGHVTVLKTEVNLLNRFCVNQNVTDLLGSELLPVCRTDTRSTVTSVTLKANSIWHETAAATQLCPFTINILSSKVSEYNSIVGLNMWLVAGSKNVSFTLKTVFNTGSTATTKYCHCTQHQDDDDVSVCPCVENWTSEHHPLARFDDRLNWTAKSLFSMKLIREAVDDSACKIISCFSFYHFSSVPVEVQNMLMTLPHADTMPPLCMNTRHRYQCVKDRAKLNSRWHGTSRLDKQPAAESYRESLNPHKYFYIKVPVKP